MSTRTDMHRVGAIVPEEYGYVFTYALARTVDGWPEPSFRVNCELDRRIETRDPETGARTFVNGKHDADGRCCIVAMLASGQKFAAHGATGKCTVCGANFNDGDVWQHIPTGELIHIGHECARKYEMLAERGDYDAFKDSRDKARAAYRLRNERTRAYDAFCEEYPGLAQDFEVEHRIIADIKSKLYQYGSLSEKQVALVRKLANEVRNPPEPEKHVPAPEGRVMVKGRVVAVKPQEFGPTKIVVKVETPEGSWLVWCTRAGAISEAARGDLVEFSAELKRGRDAHFALAKRPTKASIIETAAPIAA